MFALRIVAFFCLCCSLPGTANGQEKATTKPAPGDTDHQKAIQKHWLDVSRQYARALQVEGPGKLSLQDQPIFRHTQSVRGDDIGAVHLWVGEEGRPAMIGSIFAWTRSPTERMVSIEFHSLMDEGQCSLTHKDRRLWTNSKPGIIWRTFPEGIAPTPGSSPQSPVRQKLIARQLARRFSAETTTPKDDKWTLRFIPKPIFEYSSKNKNISYGAMFAFCQGTDSEILLLIESVAKEGSPSEWRYSLVPFTDYDATVSLDGDEIWQSPEGQMNENGKAHYWTLLEPSPKPAIEMKAP